MYGAVSLWYHIRMTEKQNSTPPPQDGDPVEITSLDVRNIIKLIDASPISVDQAELAVGLKIKLAAFHNRLLATEEAAAETQ